MAVTYSPLTSQREKDVYKKRFHFMVAGLAEEFSEKNCEKLSYIYSHSGIITRSFAEKYERNALKLLERLQEKKVFSYDKPYDLVQLLDELDFKSMKSNVEDFLDKNRAAISLFAVQQRALPPVPIIQPLSSNFDDNPDDGYTRFIPTPASLPLQVGHSTRTNSVSGRSESSRSSDQGSSAEEDVYSVPYSHCVMKSIFQEHFPLHKEHMRLLTKPMKIMISGGESKIITSSDMKCEIPRATYYLVIYSGVGSQEPYLSAKLYLKPGSQLEEESLSYNLLAELQVRQRYKKQKEQQNIYSHSVLMDIPSKPLPPIQEQCVLQPISNKGQLVASFPSIISHKNFMNEALITGPYLTFTFTLKNYSLNTVKRP